MSSNDAINSQLAGLIACPVVLMTSTDGNNRRAMVTTVSYASLKPLLLATSVVKSSRTAALAMAVGRLGISVARYEQRDLVEQLATSNATDVFAQALLEPLSFASGVLYFAESLVAFDCSIQSVTECGASVLLLLSVNDAVTLSTGEPLIRYNRQYGRLMQQSAGHDDYPV
jgi:flavin reductase (DIM6/NTAB) family NADH-FMN oxidoreductase RutF